MAAIPHIHIHDPNEKLYNAIQRHLQFTRPLALPESGLERVVFVCDLNLSFQVGGPFSQQLALITIANNKKKKKA